MSTKSFILWIYEAALFSFVTWWSLVMKTRVVWRVQAGCRSLARIQIQMWQKNSREEKPRRAVSKIWNLMMNTFAWSGSRTPVVTQVLTLQYLCLHLNHEFSWAGVSAAECGLLCVWCSPSSHIFSLAGNKLTNMEIIAPHECWWCDELAVHSSGSFSTHLAQLCVQLNAIIMH